MKYLLFLFLGLAITWSAMGDEPQGEVVAPEVGVAPEVPAASEVSTLDGDTLYKQNCLRCHMKPELKFLGFFEYSDAQLNTVVKHMQVRANFPEDEAKAILEYLTQ